jgi:hypothetical protein
LRKMTERDDLGSYSFVDRGDKEEVPETYSRYAEDTDDAGNEEVRKNTAQDQM